MNINKKTLFLVLFLIIIFIFVGFWIYRGGAFSKEILRLEILGPETANVGEEIEYTIKYKNNGNFVLESPKLTFEMPDSSLTEDGKTRIVKELQDIYPGHEDFVKIKTRLLGKEEDLKIAKAYLSYTPKNLTARYESNTTFTTKIGIVPITLDFDLSSKVEKGKDFQYSLNYFSNIDYPLENLSIKIAEVNGFTVESSNPSSLDNLEWKIKDLNKAEGGRITIKGKIDADINQNLIFNASLGMWQNNNFVVIKEATANVETIQSMLYISQQINGSANYVASPGEKLNYKIFFRNIGSSASENLFMIVSLDGPALDMTTVESEYGQVQQSGNMIVWDWKQTPQLKKINVQEEVSLEFSVKVKNDWMPESSNENDLIIYNQVNISQITQKFNIKVNSGLIISQTASGEATPTIGESNFYNIAWNIQNYSSDAKNVKVKAILPNEVKLTGEIMPSNESSNFSFDSVSREIVWSVGDILAGTGVTGDPITLSFQISLNPTASQKGFVAPLIEKVTVSGENQFTNTTISSTASAIDTSLGNTTSGIVK